MPTVEEVLERLKAMADPEKVAKKRHFGMVTDARLGIRIPPLRKMAKEIGTEHELALALWESGIAEARLLTAFLADPELVTPAQMDAWATDFNSWDVCDQTCCSLFDRTPHAWDKVREWAGREEEYVRRGAFALLAGLAVHDKKTPDQTFIDAFPLIRAAADDPRNFVKKAVNWALRNIGKRNQALNREAIQLAEELLETNDRTTSWIARDALRELRGEKVQKRLEKKNR
jgi:3-methyladenine DNA glycosylase AlkD